MEKEIDKKIDISSKLIGFQSKMPELKFNRFEEAYSSMLGKAETLSLEDALRCIKNPDSEYESRGKAAAHIYLNLANDSCFVSAHAIVNSINVLEEAGVDKKHKVYQDIEKFIEDKLDEYSSGINCEKFEEFVDTLAEKYVA